jgi:pimeloyl-ACP methyl ester carboxylesterase
MKPKEDFVQLEDIRLHTLTWEPEIDPGNKPTFLLLHGLSSNARTWEQVAELIVHAGFPVVAVDQRGHGFSDKPKFGYDFATITADLDRLVNQLGLKKLILAGQSWGGNVVLEAAARFPDLALGLVFVDGGFLDLKSLGQWDEVAAELRPPDLAGLTREAVAMRIGESYPGWIPDGVEATLGNFEHFEDGTVRPWLALENHMAILKTLYDQETASLYPKVKQPVLICVADDGDDWTERKKTQVDAAAEQIPGATVYWFEDTAHDIHVDRPGRLAELMLAFASDLQAAV